MKPIFTRRLALEFGFLVWCCVQFQVYFAGQSPATFGFPSSLWSWLGGRGRLVIGLILLADLTAAVFLLALCRGRAGRREVR